MLKRRNTLKVAVLLVVVLIIATGLSLYFFNPWQAKVGGIEGTVTYLDGEPVVGVNVGIVSGTTGWPEIIAFTDEEGYYRLGSVPAGTFEVAVHDMQGNRIGLENVIVRNGKTSTLNFVITAP